MSSCFPTTSPCPKFRALLPFVIALLAASPPVVRADNLDRALYQEAAPQIWRVIREREYKNVGVLTFRVQQGDGSPGFDVGLLNHNLAVRLENVLIFTKDPERPPVGIIRNAADTAREQLTRASYQDAADRQRLFDVRYQLAWGTGDDRVVTADALLTGKVEVSEDFRTTSVTIELIDRREPETVVPVCQLTARTDRQILADLGQGFWLPTRGIRSETEIIAANYEAHQSFQQDPRSPSANGVLPKDFPVELNVLYDGQSQTLEPGNSPTSFRMRDPEAGQRVVFDVKNTTDETLGIVLTVNGINTLYHEQGLQANQMTRWVLQPNKQYRIHGFHNRDRKTFQPIVGLSEEESRAQVDELGGLKVAGLIHLHVFQEDTEKKEDDPAPPQVARWNFRSDLWAESPSELAVRIRERTGTPLGDGRGLAAPGSDTGEQVLNPTTLNAPFQTGTITIRYYDGSQ